MDNAFRYVRDHGIATTAYYPYQAATSTCMSVSPSPFSIKTSKILYSDCTALV